jgi:hypothetical protein
MRYWFDTEFIEDGRTINLISILDLEPILSGPTWRIRREIAQEILAFCDPRRPWKNGEAAKPEFWAYYADYDWVVLCQLFGRMIDLPKGWPMYCRDIKQQADEVEETMRRLNSDPTYKLRLPEQGESEHHALADARWNRTAWEYLHSLAWL